MLIDSQLTSTLMLFPQISQELVDRHHHDFDVRQRLIEEGILLQGYNSDMEKVHLDNARRLQEIIAQIGWPTQQKVGKEGSEAAWLIVQHAISLPTFMKSCLALMNEPENAGDIDPVDVAFLSDRIAMFGNQPQSYGTQFDIGHDGQLAPYQLDVSVAEVNQRRQQLGLNSLEERLAELKIQHGIDKKEPRKLANRQHERNEYDAWRRKVGWQPD